MVIFHGELLVITRWYSLFRSLIRALQMDRSQAFSGPLERMERHWEYLGITAFRTLRISNMAPDRGRSWETHRNTRIISRCLGPTKTYQKHNKTIKNHQKPSKKTCFFRFKPWPTAPFFFARLRRLRLRRMILGTFQPLAAAKPHWWYPNGTLKSLVNGWFFPQYGNFIANLTHPTWIIRVKWGLAE